MENLKKIHDGMRVRAAQVKTSDRTEYKRIVQEAKDLAVNFTRIKRERETSEGYLKEFKYMKDVKSFEEMRKFIQTCDFWAETWALSTLETIFNLKLIVLSSENYEKKDFDNVLLCGQINSDDEIRNDAFKPKYIKQLKKIFKQLEKKYRDMQDIEFTIENKKLWLLQTRNGKRNGLATIKIAIDMLKEKMHTEKMLLQKISPQHIWNKYYFC